MWSILGKDANQRLRKWMYNRLVGSGVNSRRIYKFKNFSGRHGSSWWGKSPAMKLSKREDVIDCFFQSQLNTDFGTVLLNDFNWSDLDSTSICGGSLS